MSRSVKRLSAEDWEYAALQAIARGGLAAVAVEPLARLLGVTKGSFYAHFRDRDELVVAALARWERAHVDAFEASLEEPSDAASKLDGLMRMAIAAARGPTIQRRLLLESDDLRVRAALRRVTQIRLRRLEGVFTELGHRPEAAARRATLAYATYVGLLTLAREVPDRLVAEDELVAEILRLAHAGSGPDE